MNWKELILPLSLGFAITVASMPLFIGYFQMKRYGQEIREEGPQWHQVKAGTPTMGGVVFILSAMIAAFGISLWKNQLTTTFFISIFILFFFGLLGFLDDFIKVFKKRNLGLSSSQKLIGQIIGGGIFYVVYLYENNSNILNFFGFELSLSYVYGLFVVVWLVGFSNAVNLTDGIDGLVSGLGILSFGAYAIIAFHQQQYDILILCVSIMGSLAGFLVFNHKPAKIFMGDVGSLALGGLLAVISILLHQEWTLLLIGFIYIVETLSVMLQVMSFKLTGKRIFKMSPIHHHFEMSGWSEWKIDGVFWSVSAVCSAIALLIYFF